VTVTVDGPLQNAQQTTGREATNADLRREEALSRRLGVAPCWADRERGASLLLRYP